MLLIKNAEIHSPSPEGRCDVLAGGGKILRMHPGIKVPRRYCEVLDARNLIAVPGFIDGHVHIMGGGGEGGPASRTPELAFSDAVRGGVTTLVGCLGTDGFTRTMGGLLAKAQGLEEEGLTTFLVTGSYAVPTRTLMGSIEEDLLYIDKIIGVGEVALSDHRSSQPTYEEFARLAGETRRGGILSGKAGLVNIHMGDGRRGLEYLRRLLAETEIPSRQFLPTHINRNLSLFDEGTAYALAGGFVDMTTSTIPAFLEAGEIKPSQGLRRMLEAGVDPGRLNLELTETTLMSNANDAVTKILEIKRRYPSIMLSIDDFGTGYSSLSYLSRLPVDVLKIDISFVRALHDEQNRKVVNSILTLAESLGISVVAEGIETAAQRSYFTERSCYGMQGFLFMKAQPIEELVRRFTAIRTAGVKSS